MELQNIADLGLEGAGILLLLVLAYKLYKMKIHTASKCCGEGLQIQTDNEGGHEQINI